MNSECTYVGCFISYEKLMEKLNISNRHRLSREILNTHITFVYKPSVSYESLFGEEVRVMVTGYGINDENEGLAVKLSSDNAELNELINRIEVPHITLSVSSHGESKNTRYLTFSEIEPFEIVGKFGGYFSDGNTVTERIE